ncbi:MAG: Sulfate adenylyltransferase [Elusimicrobia bacterium]|nr:Sulfate adenylyltransferase [Elusimicrobiota bacterium]
MIAVQDPIHHHAFDSIPAHGGGVLVHRHIPSNEEKKKLSKAVSLPKISMSSKTYTDLELLAVGALSPLEGFLNQQDYESVVACGRLSNGVLWPIPICLAVSDESRVSLSEGQMAALYYDDEVVGFIHVESIFSPDKNKEVYRVFKTNDVNHPGVRDVFNKGSWYVGGRVDVLMNSDRIGLSPYNLTPRDTRRIFQQKKWKTIAGFQTRNPMHRGHEELTKKALESVDGLLIHPLVGETKEGDFPADVRMKSYEVLIETYYPKARVILAAYPGHMYFAGPREAIFHAIIRQNYGCTHFIVGRDHAGVGSYYSPYEAQELINWFGRNDLAIQPVFPSVQSAVSGTQIRELLRQGIPPSPDLMRPEVTKVLLETPRI